MGVTFFLDAAFKMLNFRDTLEVNSAFHAEAFIRPSFAVYCIDTESLFCFFYFRFVFILGKIIFSKLFIFRI